MKILDLSYELYKLGSAVEKCLHMFSHAMRRIEAINNLFAGCLAANHGIYHCMRIIGCAIQYPKIGNLCYR